MIKVITTVGTSLFENFLKQIDNSIENKYSDLKDKPSSEYKNNIEDINKIKDQTKNFLISGKNPSAEIKSIIKIQKVIKDEIEVYFICTDTILSKLAAEIIKENFNVDNITFAAPIVIPWLNVKDKIEFEREGLGNLISKLYEIYDGYPKSFILNITGGFKGMIPYLTIWAQVNSIPIKYIFEDSDALLSIPQIPINVDFSIFEKYSDLIEKLEGGLSISKNKFIEDNKLFDDNFPDIIYEINENGEYLIGLNPVGKILWENYKTFDLIKIPKGTKYSNEDHTKKRQVNEAIKELLRRLKLISDFENLKDRDIKHAHIEKDTWAYKHTSPQIRLHYKWNKNQLIVYNYFFIQSNTDDSDYSKWMKADYQDLINKDLTIINFTKENN